MSLEPSSSSRMVVWVPVALAAVNRCSPRGPVLAALTTVDIAVPHRSCTRQGGVRARKVERECVLLFFFLATVAVARAPSLESPSSRLRTDVDV